MQNAAACHLHINELTTPLAEGMSAALRRGGGKAPAPRTGRSDPPPSGLSDRQRSILRQSAPRISAAWRSSPRRFETKALRARRRPVPVAGNRRGCANRRFGRHPHRFRLDAPPSLQVFWGFPHTILICPLNYPLLMHQMEANANGWETAKATSPRWTRLSGSFTRNTCCQASGEVPPERRAGRVSGHRIDILSTWHTGGVMYTISMTNDASFQKRTVRFQLVLSDEETELLDGWQFANRIRTRSEALRTLIRLAPQQPLEAPKGSEPARGQGILSGDPYDR
jgi:hypothetical protein